MKPKQQKAPLYILLADDDKDDRFFFAKALEETPITTHLQTVSNGEELMDYLSKNSEHLPDILFLDLNIPRINGSECLTKIKHHEKLKQISVIIYSACLHDEIADEHYKTGAHYYLHKGNFSELPKCILKVLTLLEENPNQPSRDKFILNLQEV